MNANHFTVSIVVASFLVLSGFHSVLRGESVGKTVFSDSFESIGNKGLPDGWDTWEPVQPGLLFKSAPRFSRTGDNSYLVSGNGHEHAKGSLRKRIDGLKIGNYYKFTAHYLVKGIESGINSKVIPVVKFGPERNFKLLFPTAIERGWIRAEAIFQMPEKSNGSVRFELFSGWIPEGAVYWDDVSVEELTDYKPEMKSVKVAVIDAVPSRKGTSLENCDFYVSQINNICRGSDPDVICLTETFNVLNVDDSAPNDKAVSMDSEYMNRIKQVAANNNVNLVGSIAEYENGIQFNTGFLINRNGELVDKYRKAQLAETEILYTARSRGDELKVIQADFGKIGILICYDYHFPEFARALALKGADILFVPIAGDGRLKENGINTGMDHVGKAITLENRIPIVFARNNGDSRRPSRIIANDCEVVAISTNDTYIIGEVDLKKQVLQWTSANFKNAYQTFRRPQLYEKIVDDSLRLLTEDGFIQAPNPEIE